MITDLMDKDIAKILTFFSISPGSSWSRKDLQEKTMLSNVQLDNALQNLINNKILSKEKRAVYLNFENSMTKTMLEIIKKEHQRFKEIPVSVYDVLIDFSYALSSLKKIEQVYLFGSYAKLIYTQKSDIDLAIVLEKEDKKSIQNIKKQVEKLEKKYNKIIETHFFTAKDMKNKDPLIKEIQRNSIMFF